MLSYQHAYHAGNFADVHKHLTLFAVAQYLVVKKSAVSYVDTHAGRGLYPLERQETQRLQEYRQGIWPLWQARQRMQSPLLDAFLTQLTQAQPDATRLSHYPGSPWWLSKAMREQDALTLFERHPGEHDHLNKQALPEKVQRMFADGLTGLITRLPVPTPRLCGLIDPSYERRQEYQDVAETAVKALAKVRHAVLLVWYPLLPSGAHQTLLDTLAASGVRKIWQSELKQRAQGADQHGMYGSGMLVVNPPWGLDERLAGAMADITPLFGDQSQYHSDWLVGE